MAKDQKFSDLIASAGASESGPVKPGPKIEKQPNPSTAEVVVEANATTAKIDGVAVEAVAEIGADQTNRDLVDRVEAEAGASKAAVQATVEAPVTALTPEAPLDYTQAQSWQEFAHIMTRSMSLPEAQLMHNAIEAYMRNDIAIDQVSNLDENQKKVLAGFLAEFLEGKPKRATTPEILKPGTAEIPTPPVAPKEAGDSAEVGPGATREIPNEPEITARERVKNEIENIPKAEWQEIIEDIRGISGDYLAGKSDEYIRENADFARGFLSGDASINPDYLTKSEKTFLTKFFKEYLKQVEAKNKAQEAGDSAEVGPETKELPTNLEAARVQYLKALRGRMSSFSAKRKVGIGKLKASAETEFQAIKNNYEQLKKEAFLTELRGVGVENNEINEAVVNKYLEFLKTEENSIDSLATAADRSRLQKFQAWWKRHWKLRTAAGVGMMGIGGILAATGVGAGAGAAAFGIGRGVMSGTGAFMGAEATLDIRTKSLGQKGLIDEVVGSSINIKKLQKKPSSVNIDKAIKDKVFDKHSIDDLRQEIARLRVMSLAKGVTIENAGRFGEDQAPLIKNLLETYSQKLKGEMIAAGQSKEVAGGEADKEGKVPIVIQLGKTLSDHIDGNIKANENTLVSELDQQRIKDLRRYALSAAVGVAGGVLAGTRAFHKVDQVKAGDGHTWQNIQNLYAHDEQANPLVSTADHDALREIATAHQEAIINNVSEVHKGDTIWALAKEQLHQRLGAQFDQLDEARKTYLIDAIKDKVAANPSAFGLNHDIDNLRIGEQVDFTTAFKDPAILKELQTQASQLDQAALHNIIDNNTALKEAARHGVHITNENVDQVAASVKEHGADMLNPDGSVRGAVKAAQEVVSAGSETGVAKTAAEIAKQTADQFVVTADAQYSSEVFTAAKSAGSLDTVFNKLVTIGNPKQIEHFVNDWAQAEGLNDNKREIFLGSLIHNDKLELGLGGQVKVGDGMKILQENLKAFDATTLDANVHTTAEAVKAFEHLPKDQWAAVKVGDRYALAKRVVDHKLFLHKPRWLISFAADHKAEMTISDKDSLTRILGNKTFGSSVANVARKAVIAGVDKPPQPMSR